jgi:hypothetical protein
LRSTDRCFQQTLTEKAGLAPAFLLGYPRSNSINHGL